MSTSRFSAQDSYSDIRSLFITLSIPNDEKQYEHLFDIRTRIEINTECVEIELSSLDSIAIHYTFGGANALIDGLHGSQGYADGKWIGFLGSKVEIIIDLKKYHKYPL